MARIVPQRSLLNPPNPTPALRHKISRRAAMATPALASPMPLRGESGTKTPRLVYGTAWKKNRTADLVYQALKAGFRGIDTAAQPRHYQEVFVGDGIRRAIEDGLIKREDLFIQTKYTPLSGQDPQNMPYDAHLPIAEQVHASVASSLAHLSPTTTDASSSKSSNSTYLDCVLLHSPLAKLEDTTTAWLTLSQYISTGQIHHLGIANVSLPVLAHLVHEMAIKPSVVQNRFYADSRYEVPLRRFCREQGIVFQSFWTLTGNRGHLLRTALVEDLAARVAVSVQVALYALVLGLDGVSVLDGTKSEAHMVEDLEGVVKVGSWAEGEGREEWERILEGFKDLIGEW